MNRVEVVGRNTSTDLMFLVPPGLVPGDYTLDVRSLLTSGGLRVGSLDATLIVV